MEIPKAYNPKEFEAKWRKFWKEKGYFIPTGKSDKKFVIVIPPPNVTGELHLGHALNVTIQDIYVRWWRLKGAETEWLPGVDHAGIATEVVVERNLRKEGISKYDLGREKFIEKIWEWINYTKNRIFEQLEILGCSCDWTRKRFTLDPEYQKAVLKCFLHLYKKGWIYKGEYIVNWCPRCRTAISDLEVQYEEYNGKLYYIKYPLKGRGFITVATTRPETMLGDTAVAVNPQDKRYKKLIGKVAILPLMKREIPIIADDAVDIGFGTGAVKVTPAHDALDFEIAKRHNLPAIKIMTEEGKINENGGEYQGLDRFEARKRIIEDLQKEGLIEKIEDYKYSIGKCERCGTIIEPYLSTQWFVRMKEMSKPAIEAVKKGEIKFHPERWKGVFLNWMYNIKDWCISRQIWWGHRMPVYECKNCDYYEVSEKPVSQCPRCGSTMEQIKDVLDTWFSSWLWPFATFGWPEDTPDLKRFYPTNLLVTGPEIIFFWVARMIMAGFEFMGQKPFSDVYIHGTVRDEKGRKMSKSLGNTIDPLTIVEKYGVDALRFGLLNAGKEGADPHISENTFETGRNFANKLWNAFRLIMLMKKEEVKEHTEILPDKWIKSRANKLIEKVTKCLENYRINEPLMSIYEFFWHEFCDWYLEIIKLTGYVRIAEDILKKVLKLLHPFIPFITEEIWHRLTGEEESIIMSGWPQKEEKEIDEKAEDDMELIKSVITSIRNVRASAQIPKKEKLNVYISADKESERIIKENEFIIQGLSGVGKIEFKKELPTYGIKLVKNIRISIPLRGVIDIDKEIKRAEKEYNKLQQALTGIIKRLSSKDFLEKAPKEVVEKTKEKKVEYEEKLNSLKEFIALLKGQSSE